MMPYCAECGGNHELTTGGCSAAGMSNGRCAMNYEAIAKEILELAAQGDADRWIHKFDAKAAAILRAHFPNRQAFAPDAQVSAIFSDDQYALIISDDAQTQEIVLSEATMHSLLDALNGLFDDRQNISVGQTVDARDLVHRILAIGHDTTRKMPCIDDCAAEIEAAFQSRLAARGQEGARCIGAGGKVFEPLRKALDEARARAEKAEGEAIQWHEAYDRALDDIAAVKSEAKTLREALEDEHAVRVMMMEWAEKHHPPKGRDLLAYVQVRKANAELDERTRVALHKGEGSR